jgi:hypothetical protein
MPIRDGPVIDARKRIAAAGSILVPRKRNDWLGKDDRALTVDQVRIDALRLAIPQRRVIDLLSCIIFCADSVVSRSACSIRAA